MYGDIPHGDKMYGDVSSLYPPHWHPERHLLHSSLLLYIIVTVAADLSVQINLVISNPLSPVL
jgi:hypothetical protein